MMAYSLRILSHPIKVHRLVRATAAPAGLHSGIPLAPTELYPSGSIDLVDGPFTAMALVSQPRCTQDQSVLVCRRELTPALTQSRLIAHKSPFTTVTRLGLYLLPTDHKLLLPSQYLSCCGNGFLNGHIQRGRGQLRGQQLGCSP